MSAEREQQRFKAAARRFASGVTVVTTRDGHCVHGITASSFSSLSLDPLLVAVAVDHRSRLIEFVESARVFAISVLARSQRELCQYFATPNRKRGVEHFEVAASYPVETGAPVLAGCIAYFDCRLHAILPGGDHRILVGEVVAAGESGGEPLLYFEGCYHGLGLPQAGASGAAVGDAESTRQADLLAVQRAVEPTIVELAAAGATPHDLRRLTSLLKSAATVTGEPRRFTELSLEFHAALAEASGNATLKTVAASLRAEQQFAYESRTDPFRAQQVLAVHQTILDLVRGGDAAGARVAMLKHIDDMQRHFCASADSAQDGATEIGRTLMPASTSALMARPT